MKSNNPNRLKNGIKKEIVLKVEKVNSQENKRCRNILNALCIQLLFDKKYVLRVNLTSRFMEEKKNHSNLEKSIHYSTFVSQKSYALSLNLRARFIIEKDFFSNLKNSILLLNLQKFMLFGWI